MRVLRDIYANYSPDRPCVVTIGNFDGMHIGHRTLIGKTVETAAAENGNSALVSFEPLPGAFFAPHQPPARLSTPSQKLRILRRLGMDVVWLMRFGSELAMMEPVDFVRLVLAKTLRAQLVIVGDDFRFGYKRAGNVAFLRSEGKSLGFRVETISPVMIDAQKVSSRDIRLALAKGRMEKAATMLGHPYTLGGKVVAGRKLGHGLGYPTANIRVFNNPSPVSGVFAVRCRTENGGDGLPGVANIGYRPTVGGQELLLEVHLFDFKGDLYGQRMRVELVRKLRDEAHFDGLDALTEQIRLDAEHARSVLDC